MFVGRSGYAWQVEQQQRRASAVGSRLSSQISNRVVSFRIPYPLACKSLRVQPNSTYELKPFRVHYGKGGLREGDASGWLCGLTQRYLSTKFKGEGVKGLRLGSFAQLLKPGFRTNSAPAPSLEQADMYHKFIGTCEHFKKQPVDTLK